ncbi:hypothetical protein ABZ953_32920 [Streptomyces sp. NPDC046465]|uniref:hypothetical protein n=1 Tax=Streptomyces sp. NPDC046465 TaxID=3155810 RepID=UPI0033D78003
MSHPLQPAEYRELLCQALDEAVDADTRLPDPHSLFMPDSHRTALYVDNTVVLGGRGVGKTFWYRSLLDDRLRAYAAAEYRINRLNRLTVAPGHGKDMDSAHYPSGMLLTRLIDDGTDPYTLWYAVLLTALGQPDVCALAEWRDRAAWVHSHPGPAQLAVEHEDRAGHADNVVRLLLFDALEHLHRQPAQRDRVVGALLQLALEMRLSTRTIRFKVFLRPDMFRSAEMHFPDASKLASTSTELLWEPVGLYGLLFHTLGNQEDEAAQRFRASSGGWDPADGGDRYVPPPGLSGDRREQANFFTQLAGPYMGSNFRKGSTYSWLPNHLMDGNEQISPRSFLKALATAAAVTRDEYGTHEHALYHESIRRGVQKASEIRVREMTEDIPWVGTSVALLAGRKVPIERSEIRECWEEAGLPDLLRAEAERFTVEAEAGIPEQLRTGPRDPDDLDALIDDLVALGVMKKRTDDRLDLPDIYRVHLRIGRLGGVRKAS